MSMVSMCALWCRVRRRASWGPPDRGRCGGQNTRGPRTARPAELKNRATAGNRRPVRLGTASERNPRRADTYVMLGTIMDETRTETPARPRAAVGSLPDWAIKEMPSGYQTRLAEIERLSADIREMDRFARLLCEAGEPLEQI